MDPRLPRACREGSVQTRASAVTLTIDPPPPSAPAAHVQVETPLSIVSYRDALLATMAFPFMANIIAGTAMTRPVDINLTQLQGPDLIYYQVGIRRFGRVYKLLHDMKDWDIPCGSAESRNVSNMRILTLNVNILDEHKSKTLAMIFYLHRIDVLFLQDTRTCARSSRFHAGLFKEFLDEEVMVFSSPVTLSDGCRRHNVAGGVMAVIRKQLLMSMEPLLTDPSGCGAMLGIRLKVGSQRVTLVGTYWPVTVASNVDLQDHSLSLGTRIAKYVASLSHLAGISPLQFIMSVIDKWVRRQDGSIAILCGDLNQHIYSGRENLLVKRWLLQGQWSDVGWKQCDTSSARCTYFKNATTPSSVIDYILCKGADTVVAEATTSHCEAWVEISDHRPVFKVVNVQQTAAAYLPSSVRLKPWIVPKLSMRKSSEVDRFQEILISKVDLGTYAFSDATEAALTV